MESNYLGIILLITLSIIAVTDAIEIRVQEESGAADDGLVEEGAAFSIYCEVPELQLMEVLIWYKNQEGEKPVLLGFNDYLFDVTAGERFGKPQRLTEPDGSSPVPVFILNSVEGAHATDSGQYGCALSANIPAADSEDLTMEGVQWAELTVIDPIDDLKLFSLNKREAADLENAVQLVDGDEYVTDAGEEYFFRCISESSNPAAKLRVYFNEEDITDDYEEEIRTDYIGVDDKFEENFVYYHMAYTVSMTSKFPLKVDRDDNRRPFICNATVPHQETMELSVVPVMKYYPEVTCEDLLAGKGQKLVQLQCKTRSDPELTRARFRYTEFGGINETIALGETKGSTSMRKKQGDYGDEWIYYLEFNYVPDQAFREYIFEAGNAIGNVTGVARLMRDETLESKQAGNSATVSSFNHWTMIVFAITAIFVKLSQ